MTTETPVAWPPMRIHHRDAHQALTGGRVIDELMVSKAIVDGAAGRGQPVTLAQRHCLYREGEVSAYTRHQVIDFYLADVLQWLDPAVAIGAVGNWLQVLWQCFHQWSGGTGDLGVSTD